jgi:poly-gamma-glutamate capsule biosynthesis protein CapA/YwtB (metallophosphatase superfamily)
MFQGCAAMLRGADLAFGQLETTVSDRGAIVPNARLAMRAPSALAGALRDAGFGIMSFAGNHCLDWGFDAFDDTLRHMDQAGVALCGAGANADGALRPAVRQIGAARVAVIATSSILPEGYAAGPDRRGCAPMRAHTIYEQIEHDQPGTPARVRTYAHRGDLAALLAAIGSARREADIVLLSLHWGIHMVKGSLAGYQREVAHAAIEAGADAIFGHHPHIMKGVDIHRGKPIFYSLGNFAIEQPHVWDPAIVETESFRHLVSLNPNWSLDSAYMLPDETRITGAAKLVVQDDKVVEIRFLPAWIGDDSAPEMLAPADDRFGRVRDYLAEVSAAEGLATRFETEGGELLLTPG